MPLRLVTPADRFEAARRWEQLRQIIRECTRYGFPVTERDMHVVQEAERHYDTLTALLAR